MLPFVPTVEQIRAEKQRRVLLARERNKIHRFDASPSDFARHCIDWPKNQFPTAYQFECWDTLAEKKRLSIRGPHSLGKTFWASILLLWFALTRDGRDWKIPTTASSWRQLNKFLWPEIHKWARQIKWDQVGRPPFDTRTELMAMNLKLKTGEAFAIASDQPELMEGAHADHLLYMFDEAKAIPPATFDAAEGAFAGSSSGEIMAVCISTPGGAGGRFYDIQTKKPGFEDWSVRHVTLREAVNAGRVSLAWADQRKRQWGETSPIYANRVLGEFAEASEFSLIPLAWVEAAIERWFVWKEKNNPIKQLEIIGVDVSRGGTDYTSLAHRCGQIIETIDVFHSPSTTFTTDRIMQLKTLRGGEPIVDVIGIGAGVVDQLRERECECIVFNAASSAVRMVDGRPEVLKDKSGEVEFLNMRAAAWWHMRELLDPANNPTVALPPDDDVRTVHLVTDLTTPQWGWTPSGKLKIEEKSDIRKRLGRSTDCGDAVVEAFAVDIMRPITSEWVAWGASKGGKDLSADEQRQHDMRHIEQSIAQSGWFVGHRGQ